MWWPGAAYAGLPMTDDDGRAVGDRCCGSSLCVVLPVTVARRYKHERGELPNSKRRGLSFAWSVRRLCCARVFGRVRSFVMVRLCLSSRFVCVVGTPNGQMAFSLNTCTSMAVSGHSKLLHPASMAIGLWQADGEELCSRNVPVGQGVSIQYCPGGAAH